MFIIPGYGMLVGLNNITSITASSSKFISNLWAGNTWIRIFVRECLANLLLVKLNLTLAFLQNILQSFSILFCVTLEYIGMKGSLKCLVLILGVSPDTFSVLVLIAFWKNFFMTLSIMWRGYWFLSRTCLKSFRSISKLVPILLILYINQLMF